MIFVFFVINSFRLNKQRHEEYNKSIELIIDNESDVFLQPLDNSGTMIDYIFTDISDKYLVVKYNNKKYYYDTDDTDIINVNSDKISNSSIGLILEAQIENILNASMKKSKILL